MEWLRSNVFGGVGVSDEQLQHNSAADEDVPSSSAAASPSPRLRKRNKRDEAGVNSNYEEDSNDDNDNYDNFVSGLLGRRLNFTSHDNTSDHEEEEEDEDDEVHNNKSTDGSEEDALNTTIDTVENPVVEDVNDEEDDDCSGEAGGEERVYVNNDAMERPHVQMDKAHWRDMLWDPIKYQFYYPSSGVEPPDGIPAADGYRIVPPSDADMQVRVVFNLSRDIIMASYDEEVEQLLETFNKLEIPKTQEGISEHLFGAKSRLVQTLVRRLKQEPRDIHKFLATIYFAAELGLPSKRLQQHPNIKFDEYMDQKTLNSFWRDVARIGKDGGEPTYLWQSVEESLNGDCRDLFLSVGQQKYKLRVALDDDKVHFQFSTISVVKDKSFLCGLSPQQHTKANRRGMTIDSAVSATTGFPLCFRARRESFSGVQNYEAMLRFMFQYKFSKE